MEDMESSKYKYNTITNNASYLFTTFFISNSSEASDFTLLGSVLLYKIWMLRTSVSYANAQPNLIEFLDVINKTFKEHKRVVENSCANPMNKFL